MTEKDNLFSQEYQERWQTRLLIRESEEFTGETRNQAPGFPRISCQEQWEFSEEKPQTTEGKWDFLEDETTAVVEELEASNMWSSGPENGWSDTARCFTAAGNDWQQLA